ncbi:hypothetical protein FN976_12855 [Caenimonas sedimenti]|uniref:Alpha 1,4-glycosyltransferase domain-containing protein n=2 Tax=Caenimonas sedimenti TaxID=2596921 RepID=A0A562ZRK0_9BURK|nr:hypothetical protein FN976_12855 [Caenimonas sedimenti]
MLWVTGRLSRLETVCMDSFIQQGYRLALWTYSGVDNAPAAADMRDARDILPESAIFVNQGGSYAGFSNVFRYGVLRKLGGMWADSDVIAIKPAGLLPAIPFLVTERTSDGKLKINNNVIHSPAPKSGDLMDLAFAYASVFPKEQLTWGDLGPTLLTGFVNMHPRHGYAVMAPDFANSSDWWTAPHSLLAPGNLPDCSFLHLYNEMWRRAGVDKNAPYPEQSLIAAALRKGLGE